MVDAGVVAAIKARFAALKPVMDERICRLYAAAEAKAIGRGGPAAVTQATGILGKRIRAGLRDLAALRRRPPPLKPGQQRIRRPGAGRKRLVQTDPTLLRDLEALVEPSTRGDPQSPLRWTCKSVRKLAAELRARGTRSAPRRWASCSPTWATACRAIARRRKARHIRTATRSSSTSTPRSRPFSSGARP